MAQKTRLELKNALKDGEILLGANLANLIDSHLHSDDGVAITSHVLDVGANTYTLTFSDGSSDVITLGSGAGEITIADVTGLSAILDSKVDKVSGKELSTNDYSDEDKLAVGNSVTHAANDDIHVSAEKSAQWGDGFKAWGNQEVILTDTDNTYRAYDGKIYKLVAQPNEFPFTTTDIVAEEAVGKWLIVLDSLASGADTYVSRISSDIIATSSMSGTLSALDLSNFTEKIGGAEVSLSGDIITITANSTSIMTECLISVFSSIETSSRFYFRNTLDPINQPAGLSADSVLVSRAGECGFGSKNIPAFVLVPPNTTASFNIVYEPMLGEQKVKQGSYIISKKI